MVRFRYHCKQQLVLIRDGNLAMLILVTGATGTVGGHVVDSLAGHGHTVRALVRDRSRASLPPEVEIVEGDLTDSVDVRRSLDGVDRAFLNMADDNGKQFAAVAGELGLGHVVLLSSFAAVLPLPGGDDNIITSRHVAGEQALTDAGVPSTFLRAAGFDYNILMWSTRIKEGVIAAPFPDARLPIVDPRDIAACAAAVLVSPSAATGPFMITGPEKVSTRDQAAVLADLLSTSIRVEQLSEAAAARAFPVGTPDFVVSSVLGTQGEQASQLSVSRDVQALTGAPARTFGQWATDHVHAFS